MTDDKTNKENRSGKPLFNKGGSQNPWKWAFLTLVVLLLGSGIFLGTRIFAIREPHYQNAAETTRQGDPILTINSNKKQVNQIIDFYLEEYLKDSEVKYSFALENEAMLSGEFKVLNFPVTVYLYFDPYVMENGNVQLRATNLSIGTLNLPLKEVMKMVKRSFKFPEWIEVDPEDKSILIRLDQFQMQNGLFIKANRINLLDDEIQFGLYLPKDNTGNDQNGSSSETEK